MFTPSGSICPYLYLVFLVAGARGEAVVAAPALVGPPGGGGRLGLVRPVGQDDLPDQVVLVHVAPPVVVQGGPIWVQVFVASAAGEKSGGDRNGQKEEEALRKRGSCKKDDDGKQRS